MYLNGLRRAHDRNTLQPLTNNSIRKNFFSLRGKIDETEYLNSNKESGSDYL